MTKSEAMKRLRSTGWIVVDDSAAHHSSKNNFRVSSGTERDGICGVIDLLFNVLHFDADDETWRIEAFCCPPFQMDGTLPELVDFAVRVYAVLKAKDSECLQSAIEQVSPNYARMTEAAGGTCED